MTGPLDSILDMIPAVVREVVLRETPIPAIAERAAALKKLHPMLVRADIGQVSKVDPTRELLYGPATGLEELREALAEHYNLTYQLAGREGFGPQGLTARNLCISTGAAESLTVAFRCFAHEKVVGIPRGYWENYVNGVLLGGGRAVVVDYFADDGSLDLVRLEAQIKAENISVLLVNFPNNPTGAVLTSQEAETFAALCRRLNLMVIADEVYARLRFDGEPPYTMLMFLPERAISISSASKEYLLAGGRVGYTLSAREVYTDQVMRKMVRANTANPNVPGQQRLLAVVKEELADLRAGNEPQFLTMLRDALDARRRALVRVLTKHEFPMRGRPGHEPMGTIFLMSGLPTWWKGTAESFAKEALEAGCCSTVPGDSFGLENALRWSFGGLAPSEADQLDLNLTTFRASR